VAIAILFSLCARVGVCVRGGGGGVDRIWLPISWGMLVNELSILHLQPTATPQPWYHTDVHQAIGDKVNRGCWCTLQRYCKYHHHTSGSMNAMFFITWETKSYNSLPLISSIWPDQCINLISHLLEDFIHIPALRKVTNPIPRWSFEPSSCMR
jgi:hypothetical protein